MEKNQVQTVNDKTQQQLTKNKLHDHTNPNNEKQETPHELQNNQQNKKGQKMNTHNVLQNKTYQNNIHDMLQLIYNEIIEVKGQQKILQDQFEKSFNKQDQNYQKKNSNTKQDEKKHDKGTLKIVEQKFKCPENVSCEVQKQLKSESPLQQYIVDGSNQETTINLCNVLIKKIIEHYKLKDEENQKEINKKQQQKLLDLRKDFNNKFEHIINLQYISIDPNQYLKEKTYNNKKHTIIEHYIVSKNSNHNTNSYYEIDDNLKIDNRLIKLCKDNLQHNYSKSDFFNSCKNGDLQAVFCIIEKEGSNILDQIDEKDYEKKTGFLYACENGRYDIIRMMHEQYQVDIEQQQIGGWTGLLYACYNNHIKVLELLLKYKVKIEHKSKIGSTGLLLACQQNFTKIIKILLENKANIYQQNKYGQTPFLASCFNNNVQVVNMILKRGYKDIDHKNSIDNKSGYQYLTEDNKMKVRQYIDENKIDVKKPQFKQLQIE